MSWIAAPCSAVTMPTARGQRGNGRFRSSANSPSTKSFAFSCSYASVSAPSPRGSIASTYSWSEPRAGYTSARARTTTSIPSVGWKTSTWAALRNITAASCVCLSFSVK